MEDTQRPCVLIFAGADPSGGAGIAADIQAITVHGAHPLPVITALTVQDNDRVFSVHPVAAELVQQQAKALIDKITISAIKIGIVGNAANAEVIAAMIRAVRQCNADVPVVFDPVLASGHGDALSVDNAAQALQPLFALASLIVPNLPEATALCSGVTEIPAQATYLLGRGCQNVLIKGGHAIDGEVVNRWFSRDAHQAWCWPRLQGQFHGSGCTLASAIAALLARGLPMQRAIESAQNYCWQALENSFAIAAGQRIPERMPFEQ